jgi:hypothetical protein
MKRTFSLIVLLCLWLMPNLNALDKTSDLSPKQTISFTENKGQVSDQNHKPRPDVLYSGSVNGMVYHLRNNGISYQLNRVDEWTEHENAKFKTKSKVPARSTIYRLDINWLNTQKNFTMEQDQAFEGCANYYLEVCPQGIHNVRTYQGVTYKNIYEKIDLHFYEKAGVLKYDFIVSPNADYKQIQMEIRGAEKIELLKDGSVKFKTPLGEITEGAPQVYQNGKQLTSRWILSKNIISFEIEKFDPSQTLIIDPPIAVWGTYYGGNSSEEAQATVTDANGDIYITGYSSTSTGTNVATFGSHQFTFGGNSYDAYLVKFTPGCSRIWATYYGGAWDDYSYTCATDLSGNVFIAGRTSSFSSSVIATPSSHQPAFGGALYDGYLVKFNSSGVRQWGTYYGGIGSSDAVYACCTDLSGNVYITGNTDTGSSTVIATPGSYQTTGQGGFLAKFNTSGVRLWGTYYATIGYGLTTDASGNIYFTGNAGGSTGVSTPGTYQPNFSGGGSSGWGDAVLAKFSSAGALQWGTYYGGYGKEDIGYSCAVDANGNVFMVGSTKTYTSSIIATLGTEDPYGPSSTYTLPTGYVAKFDGTGNRLWGTYGGWNYTATGSYAAYSCVCDQAGNIIYAGTSAFFSGKAILAKYYGSNGILSWQADYGINHEQGYGCVWNPNGIIYMAGTSSGNGVAVGSSAWQGQLLGGSDAILVKYEVCSASPLIYVPYGSPICPGETRTLIARGSDTYTWLPTAANTVTLVQTPTVSTTYTLIGSSIGCTNTTQDVYTLTVYALPQLIVPSGAICPNGTFAINSSGAQTYTVFGGSVYGVGPSIVVGPTVTTSYSVIATYSNNCESMYPTVVTVSVSQNPTVIAAASSTIVCSGYSVGLMGSGANTYTWQPAGLTGSNITLYPSSTANYSLNGTNLTGCKSQTSSIITVSVIPSPVVNVNSGNICIGKSFTMAPSGGSSFTYTPAGPIVSPTVSTSYTVVTTGANGCVGKAVSNVVVNPLPVVSLQSGSVCLGKTFNLNPSGAASYNLQGGTAMVSPTVTTSYTATGTSAAGCQSATFASATVTVNPLPVITGQASPSAICEGETSTLTASGGNTYTWNPGGAGTTITVQPTGNMQYVVTGMGLNGCVNTATVSQFVDPCVSISKINPDRELWIYPNPHAGLFTVVCDKNRRMEITNALGQVILRGDLIEGKNNIDITEYSNGIYFIRLSDDNYSKTLKIVKE